MKKFKVIIKIQAQSKEDPSFYYTDYQEIAEIGATDEEDATSTALKYFEDFEIPFGEEDIGENVFIKEYHEH